MTINIKLPKNLIAWIVFFFCINSASAQNGETDTGPPTAPKNTQSGPTELSDADRLRDESPPHPTPNELKQIRKTVDIAFNEFIKLWSEERYFQLYDWGGNQSRKFISAEEFATRMVQLDWVPLPFDPETPFEVSVQYRTLIYVNAVFEFQHKTNASLHFKKKQTFLLLWEDQKWRFDLLQMLRSPFYTPFGE